MIFFAGLLAAAGGMYCFALTQSKQAALLLRKPLSQARRRWCIAGGFSGMTLSGALGVYAYGIGIGLVTLCAWACVGGWSVALWITHKRARQTTRFPNSAG